MARLRKFCAYRRLERPNTRTSKYRAKSYVRARPVCKVVRFVAGNAAGEFDTRIELIAKHDLQIRDNALESARQSSNRFLAGKLGTGFRLTCRKYPHHILRENPLAAGAGADRMSTGMSHSFGKVHGIAAQVKRGDAVFEVECNKASLEVAKQGLKKAAMKLPMSYFIETKLV